MSTDGDITYCSRLRVSDGSNRVTTQVAGYACLEQFYESDITTHGEVWECFLTPDGRGQLVAVGAQPQMIKIHSPSRSCATGWSGPLGIFLSILVQVSGLLCLVSIFSSDSNALPSDLEILQQFLLQELNGLQ